MTDFGITLDGFVLKRLDDIKTEIETKLREGLGNGINLLPTELLGIIVGIVSEGWALDWEKFKDQYDSFFPDLANGIALDNVVSITGIKRLEATKGTGVGTAFGILGTVIPIGAIVSVDGNSASRWVVTEEATLGAGTDEVQQIDFSAVPDAGDWTLVFDGDETGTLAFNDNAAAVAAALNSISSLTGVTVTGDYTAGFEVTFGTADGSAPQPTLQIGTNTLTNTAIQVNVDISVTTEGVLPNVECQLQCETAGNIQAYANTLTVIETPISGWDSFNNENDMEAGNDIETDAELRLRRNRTLSTAGAATLDAIRSRLLEIDEVTDARVFENDTDVVDDAGRPPHSFEAVVENGDQQEIIDTIWDVKAAGIATDGDITGTALDSMGFEHDVSFSRPSPVTIYVIVDNLEVDATFPVDGHDAIKQAIAEFGDTEFGIGDDVIYNKIFCPLAEIEGIIDFDLYIDITVTPAAQDNITIADDETSFWDTANITVIDLPS